MTEFETYLKQNNFLPHREIYCEHKKQYEYIKIEKDIQLSSVISGCLTTRWIKDGYPIIEIGLNEKGSGLSVVNPRDVVRKTIKGVEYSHTMTDEEAKKIESSMPNCEYLEYLKQIQYSIMKYKK